MDSTSLWAFWQKYRNKVGLFAAGILLFVLGTQVGFMTSPYYASTPITFQSGQVNDHGGTSAALDEVQKANDALSDKKAATIMPTNNSGQLPANVTDALYVASKNSTLFHDVRCPTAKRISLQNLISFTNKDAAVAAGFSPSACTQSFLNQAK